MIQPLDDAKTIWQQPGDMLAEWESSQSKAAQEQLIAGLVGEAGKVADLGCGNGRYAGVINYITYTGFDGSAAMIQAAKERNPNVEFALVDIFRFQSDESYDTVLLIDVAYHQTEPVEAVLAILHNWFAQRYFITLLLGHERQELLNSTIVSFNEMLELHKQPGFIVQRTHIQRIANEDFDWLLLEIERT